ncbi:MAG: PQQ-binding-like beta-propeller repeat protein [Acidobacteriota bacterium]
MRNLLAVRGESTIGRAHGACEASSRREEELMRVHRRRRATQRLPATPVRPRGSGVARASAALALLDNVPHCLRRAALHLPLRRSERGLLCFHHGLLCLILGILFIFPAHAENWPGWLGPAGLGVSFEEGIPTKWDEDRNIKWKVEIPGLGHSSPIVWGDRIFVTTAVSSDPAADDWQKGFPMAARNPDTAAISWQVLCFDRDTGKLLWLQTAAKAVPVNFRHLKNSYASQTPVTDGTYVYAFFGDEGMYCYDFQGNMIWSKDLGDFKMRQNWGMGSSPVLYENLVIQTCDQETGESFIVAMDKRTGEIVWKQDREELSSWSTPHLYLEGDHPELPRIDR